MSGVQLPRIAVTQPAILSELPLIYGDLLEQ
jgi:hypothetical protein